MACENFTECVNSLGLSEAFTGGLIGAIIAIGVVIAVLFSIAVYIYLALGWMTIAKKRKHKYPWLAWIPFANVAMWLQLGGFHWAWIFLTLVPILGWIALFVLFIISNWKVFEELKYPGWYSLSLIIPKVGGILYMVAIGFIAWSKGDSNITPMKKMPKKRKKKK